MAAGADDRFRMSGRPGRSDTQDRVIPKKARATVRSEDQYRWLITGELPPHMTADIRASDRDR
jgi:hypothetical protein